MDAVLPLTLRDLDRAMVLLDSLAARFEGLGTLWIVCPDVEARIVSRCLRDAPLARNIRVEAEGALVPELRLAPRMKGWHRQQLVKLALHEHVQSELYLTLDADVICTKRVTPDLLAPGGLGLCHVIDRDLHPDWYRGSEAVLGLKGLKRGVLHNVTPAVLHRRAVAELAQYLEARVARDDLAGTLRGLKQKLLFSRAKHFKAGKFASWRLFLAGALPWTEYALYYTFLEATARFAQFHRYSEACIYDIERSVWKADRDDFGAWDPGPSFQGQDPPWFLIVQSNTGIAVERVRQKLERYSSNA